MPRTREGVAKCIWSLCLNIILMRLSRKVTYMYIPASDFAETRSISVLICVRLRRAEANCTYMSTSQEHSSSASVMSQMTSSCAYHVRRSRNGLTSCHALCGSAAYKCSLQAPDYIKILLLWNVTTDLRLWLLKNVDTYDQWLRCDDVIMC